MSRGSQTPALVAEQSPMEFRCVPSPPSPGRNGEMAASGRLSKQAGDGSLSMYDCQPRWSGSACAFSKMLGNSRSV